MQLTIKVEYSYFDQDGKYHYGQEDYYGYDVGAEVNIEQLFASARILAIRCIRQTYNPKKLEIKELSLTNDLDEVTIHEY